MKALKEGDGKVIISIRDNGMGIPGDIYDNIFVPFFSTKKDGSGIGLSFSRQVMRLHRGSIRVGSKEMMGTEVLLEF